MTKSQNPDLITYLTWRRDYAQKYGEAECESFTYEELSRIVTALTVMQRMENSIADADPNLIYPGKDDTNVFPEEEP